MKVADFSPASSPSLDEQRDALRKGLGRSMRWALDRRLDDEPLLAACLRDQRFDKQVEDSRGAWLWQLMQATAAADRFRVPILHELYSLSDDRSVKQLCELARQYAATGDEAFRTRLYEIVESKPVADSPWLGERDLIELDGEKAFLFAARVRGGELAHRDWDWDDISLIEDARERFGDTRVESLLEVAVDNATQLFRNGWEQQKKNRAERRQHRSQKERMQAITLNEILTAAESAGEFQIGPFRRWGIYASEEELNAILGRLWTAQEPRITASLLKVFSSRALPRFDTRLIELCQHDDKNVQRCAFIALEQNKHVAIREFALARLHDQALPRFVVALLVKNYAEGDERRIQQAVELPSDKCELHWLLMDVIKVLEANPQADRSELGVIAYARTPCQNCRHDAARLLLDHPRRARLGD